MLKHILRTGLLCICLLSTGGMLHAETTTPQNVVYNGYLVNSAGVAIATPHTVRFSIWNSSDVVAGDIVAGVINAGSPAYLGWQEQQTVTPNSAGFFSVSLGDVTPLFGIETINKADLLSMYLQVEVKADPDPVSAYELLDINTSSATEDRSPMRSVPFALNADFIDQREIGTGSGDIALLENGGVFSPTAIPGGTDFDSFTIDFDDTAGGDITLQFGDTLGKTLVYDQANSYFTFNDDLQIQGNLFVTGLINGIDLSSIASTDTHLRVSSGAGLTFDVAAGNYRINDTLVDYAGSASNVVADNATNYVFFTDAGLTVNQTGFPADRSFIPLAVITTVAGNITAVDDRRALQSDTREEIVTRTLYPLYEGVSYRGDGTDNTGKLQIQHDIASNSNYYSWNTTNSDLQDYVVDVQLPVPENFVSWETGTLELSYRTTTANTADNKIDVYVLDSAGSAVTLVGTSTDLASTTWATTTLNFSGTPTWTPGEDLLIRLKVFAKNPNEAHLGRLKLTHKEI